jgi:AcrR family transcriptional regulator
MITKAQLLKCSIEQFTQYGSKHKTLDALASSLGVSKKTIYTFFDNKEDLVTCSLESLLNAYREYIKEILINNNKDPIFGVIFIYKRGFEYLKYFKPSFLFDLEKYYPRASTLFDPFIEELSIIIIYKMLKKAQEAGTIRTDVNLELIVKISFFKINNLVFKAHNLFEFYPKNELLEHLVIFNLKGIITRNYSNSYFE